MLRTCITTFAYVLIDPISVFRMHASQCSMCCWLHWFSTMENSVVTCFSIFYITRTLSAWDIKERIPLLKNPEYKSLLYSMQHRKTSKHSLNWKYSGLNSIFIYIHVSRWPSLSEASSLSMNDTVYEGQRETKTPGRKHTELTSKNEICSKLPKPASYLCWHNSHSGSPCHFNQDLVHLWSSNASHPQVFSLARNHYHWAPNSFHIN